MKRSPLEHVKRLIKRLSAEDRQQLIPFLGDLPDSGLHSYDLREELKVLKKHGKRLTGPGGDDDFYLVNLVFVRNLVSVQVLETEVMRVIFFPDNFIEAFPKSRRGASLFSQKFKEHLFTEERKQTMRADRAAQGIKESDAELEAVITKTCDDIGEYWIGEKAKRIAEQISLHLPGMVGDMMAVAIKGQTFYDFAQVAKESGKAMPSMKEFKKLVQKRALEDMKPHLPSTKHIRTPQDWQGDEVLKRYAALVNERHLLTTGIKDKFTECDEAEDWIEDLREDANFQKLSAGINKDALNRAIRRTADSSFSDRERQPLAIALDMARFELGLTELDIETLDDKYGNGNKLIKAERAQRKGA